MVEDIVGLVAFLRVPVSDRVRPSSFLYFYSHMDYCMYPITSIAQLTIMRRSSWLRSLRLRCSGAGDHVNPWSGVTGRCEIPKGMEKPSVRRIERKPQEPSSWNGQQGRGFTDMQKPKVGLGTFSDASCITHGVNFAGGGAP
jgi:hypothetical protein